MNTWNPDFIARAWQFATLAHQGQHYGDPDMGVAVPYIHHVADVAFEVSLALTQSSAGLNGDLAMACALLHDVIEDSQWNQTALADHFGVEVAQGVAALSKNPSLADKQSRMDDSLTRIQGQPKEIWMVKLADRIANLSSPIPSCWPKDKCQRYAQEGQHILDELGQANDYLAKRLAEKIHQYQEQIATMHETNDVATSS